MKLFNSNYFGNFTMFEFEDCSKFTELAKGGCELSNHLELHNSIGFIMIALGSIFALYLLYIIFKMIFTNCTLDESEDKT